jgi:hypothetical protein
VHPDTGGLFNRSNRAAGRRDRVNPDRWREAGRRIGRLPSSKIVRARRRCAAVAVCRIACHQSRYGVLMGKHARILPFAIGNVTVLRLRRTMPAVLAATVVALAAGCSLVEMPSNRVLAGPAQTASASATAPSGGTTPATSAPAAGARPAWAQALGADVVLTAPAAAAPGHDSPGAAMHGYVSALNAGRLIQTCKYYPPSAQAICRTTMGDVHTGSSPTIRDFALGFVAVDGNRALVGVTGTFCVPHQTPACTSNHDPAAIFSAAKPFPRLWAESVAADISPTTNRYSLAPCVKIGTKWYVYNPGPGGNA